MRKEEIRKRSSIKTESEAYNEAYKYCVETCNARPYEERNLFAMWDLITSIREAELYLNSYGDLVPPKLVRVMKERMRNSKKLLIKYYQEMSGRKEDLL